MAFRSIGLELGGSAVRACELLVGGEVPSLVTFHEVQVPPGAIVGGEIQDRNVVIERLKRLWDEGDFSQNRVTIGVAGLRAIIRELRLPYVPDSEIESAARVNAQEVIPFPPDKQLVSARVISDVSAPDGTIYRNVLVAAAHKDMVDPILEVLDAVGLVPVAIDLSALALVRAALQALNPLPTPGPEAIVSFGATSTMVVVHENGQATFVRTVNRGGDTLTEAIASTLDVPFQDAEAIKLSLREVGAQYERAAAAVRDALTPLLGEVRSSVDYYATIEGKSEVQRIAVTGGASLLEGFIPRMQAQFRVPVVPLNVLPRLDTSQVELSPEDVPTRGPVMTVAVGLALPERPGVKRINLVPPEVVERAQKARLQRWALIAFIAVTLILLAVGIVRYLNYNSTENTLSSDRAQIARLQSEIAALNTARREEGQLSALKTAISKIESSDINWVAVNQHLNQALVAASQATGSTGAYFNQQPCGCLFALTSGSLLPPSSLNTTGAGSGTAPGASSLPSSGASSTSGALGVISSLSVNSGSAGYPFVGAFLNALKSDPYFIVPSNPVTSIQQVNPPSGPGAAQVPVTFSVEVVLTNKFLATSRASYYGVTP